MGKKKKKITAFAVMRALGILGAAGIGALQTFAAAKQPDSPGGTDVTEEELTDIVATALAKAAAQARKHTGIDLLPAFAQVASAFDAIKTAKQLEDE